MLPPLRTRPEDIPLLANYFIDKYRSEVPQDIHGLSEAARICATEPYLAGQCQDA